MNVASCLEKFMEEQQLAIDMLTARLEDENREYDPEAEDSSKESIRIHNKTIEIAKQILFELDS